MTHLTNPHVKTDIDKIMDKILEIELRDSIRITYQLTDYTLDTTNIEVGNFAKTLGFS